MLVKIGFSLEFYLLTNCLSVARIVKFDMYTGLRPWALQVVDIDEKTKTSWHLLLKINAVTLDILPLWFVDEIVVCFFLRNPYFL